jgi:hypothetical protein
MRNRRSQSRLKVVKVENRRAPIQVENLLRTKINYLLLADSDGQTYWSTDIEQGESVEPQPREAGKALIDMRTILDENRPMVPRVTYSGFIKPLYFHDEMAATFSTSVLERRIHSAVEPGRKLEPRSYIAFTQSSIDVPIGTKAAEEEAGFHVIEGRW